ncbi:MAG: cupin domain-containing protein [Oscillospiraceae bacterium]|nr:cupin domain-containing protein [Oscillospiraceae bacterium]
MDIIHKGETKSVVMPDGALRSIVACDEDVTLVYMRSEKSGDVDSAHSHPHRQVVYVMQGSGRFKVGSEVMEVTAGDCISIPSDVPHCFVRFLEHTEWLEFFAPGRADLAHEFQRI